MSVRRAVWWLHLGLGLTAGAVLAVIGASGAVLALKEPLLRWELGPLVRAAAAPADPVMWARVAQREEKDGRRLMAVMAPGAVPIPAETVLAFLREAGAPGGPRHHVVAIDPGSGRVVGSAVFEETLFRHVLELHRTVLAGERGRLVVAVCGVALCVSLLGGIWLWWPHVAHVRWRQRLLPAWHGIRGRRAGVWWPHVAHVRWRQRLLPAWHGIRGRRAGVLHAVGGVYLAAPLLVLAVSGVALARPDWVAPLLAASSTAHAPPAPVPAPVPPSPCMTVPDLASAVAAALRAAPGSDFVTASPAPGGSYRVGLGKTTLVVDARCGDVHPLPADAAQPQLRVRALLGQAHATLLLGIPGQAVVLLAGLALPALLGSGLIRLSQRWTNRRR